MIVGKFGGAVLGKSGRDATGFIPPDHRWFWTAGHWNMERRGLLAQYVRATLGTDGMPVKTLLVLDIDKHERDCREARCTVDHQIMSITYTKVTTCGSTPVQVYCDELCNTSILSTEVNRFQLNI